MTIKNILIVDDNEIDVYVTKQVLLKENAAEYIITLYSAVDALRYLEEIGEDAEKIPEYIFLDIRMPEMDGFQFLNKYAAFPENMKKSKIFMLTSSRDPNDIDRAKKYAFVAKFLTKPLSREIIRGLFL